MPRPPAPIALTDAERRDLITLIQQGPEDKASPQFEMFNPRGRQVKGWTTS